MARSRRIVDDGEEALQVGGGDGAGQAVGLAQEVAPDLDRAGDVVVVGGEEGVEGDDGGEVAVDGAGLEAQLEQGDDKVVDVLEGDGGGRDVAGDGAEAMENEAVIFPGSGGVDYDGAAS